MCRAKSSRGHWEGHPHVHALHTYTNRLWIIFLYIYISFFWGVEGILWARCSNNGVRYLKKKVVTNFGEWKFWYWTSIVMSWTYSTKKYFILELVFKIFEARLAERKLINRMWVGLRAGDILETDKVHQQINLIQKMSAENVSVWQ